jgi:hypothetical protein
MSSLIGEPEGRRRQILMNCEPTLRAHGQSATSPVDAWKKWNLNSPAWQSGKVYSIRARSIRCDRVVTLVVQAQDILERPRENQVSTKTLMGGGQDIQSRGNSTPRRSTCRMVLFPWMPRVEMSSKTSWLKPWRGRRILFSHLEVLRHLREDSLCEAVFEHQSPCSFDTRASWVMVCL